MIMEFFSLSIIIAVAIWIIENYLILTNTKLLFSLFFISLIPSYNFIISPLKYLFSRQYKKSRKFEEIIKKKGFDYNIIVITGNVMNAYATGILPFSKTILIGEKLKNNMTENNLLSIIYHEIGHLKLNHLAKNYFINIILSLISILIFFIREYYFGKEEFSVFEPLSIFILGLSIGICFWYIPGKVQYKSELEADYFASKIVGAENYEKALMELDLLSNGDVSKGGITHPKLSKRIENIYKK